VKAHRWLRRLLVTVGYVVVWFLAIGVAAGGSDLAALLTFTCGLFAPLLLWVWRFARRSNSRRPGHIVAALRRVPMVQVNLPRGMSSTWDPTQGLLGRISGPGVAEYRMAGDTSVHFSYRGRWGSREATATIPAVLISGTREAAVFASAKRWILGTVFAFCGLLPAVFVVGYFLFGGRGEARVEHASIAVVVALCLYVVATVSLGVRRRWPRSHSTGTGPPAL
jgi:hypothetical protein